MAAVVPAAAAAAAPSTEQRALLAREAVVTIGLVVAYSDPRWPLSGHEIAVVVKEAVQRLGYKVSGRTVVCWGGNPKWLEQERDKIMRSDDLRLVSA